MKKHKTQKLSKSEVYVRYLLGAALILLVLMTGLSGFPMYLILTFTAALVYSGIVERSYLKALYCDRR